MLPARFAVPVLSIALAGSLSPDPATAQNDETEAIRVGSPAPDFELRDSSGKSWQLSELVKNGPVVLEFFRSGGW